MKNNLKITISVVASLLVGLLLGMIINKTFSNEKLTKLPNPEVTVSKAQIGKRQRRKMAYTRKLPVGR